ncbi:CDP-alcohol phosphatidyltransferase family protein [Plantibacter sp. Leaf314]|uniref:CDP-alcohol phosphatidyltransferase family protein n=1 Tax=Plantibacter sp. Leaf314 TaxID=1736333 RepID=UPI000A681BBF|nr:CDP-alcohol phosphatidyltransferase family protein [Plantibacter sp. Leaf314]
MTDGVGRGVRRTGEDRLVTIPNALSVLRILLVPVFLILLVQGEDLWALVTLAFSGVTDLLDGWIARRFDQMTRLGRQLDPAADRLYIIAALIGLAARDLIPWWLLIVVVARDVLLIGLAVVLHRTGTGVLPVTRVGKWGTALLFIGLPVLMLGAAFPAVAAIATPLGWVCSIAGAALYWWAGILYLLQTVRIARADRSGRPHGAGSVASPSSGRLDRHATSDTLDGEEVDGG